MAKKPILTKRDDAEAVLVTAPALVKKLEKANPPPGPAEKAGSAPQLVIKAEGAAPAPPKKIKPGASPTEAPPPPEEIAVEEDATLEDAPNPPEELEASDAPEETAKSEAVAAPPEDAAASEKAKRMKAGKGSPPEEMAEEMGEMEEGMDEGMMEDEEEEEKPRVEAEPMVAYGKSAAVPDPLLVEAGEALAVIQKAIAAPGGGTKELLAQAAEFVAALRDYANTIAAPESPADEGPQGTATPEVEGGDGATEGQAAVADKTPAPAPGSKAGGNPYPLPEEAVTNRPHMSEAQEEATESPEEHAEETPEDEAEERRLQFRKIPTKPAEARARAPASPTGGKQPAELSGNNAGVKARTAPGAEVKSAAAHPAEAFLENWAAALAPVLKGGAGRQAKLSAVQKALNEFGPAVVELINALTPPDPSDLTALVQEEVQKALAGQQQQYAAQLGALEAQLQALRQAAITGEVKSVLGAAQSGPQRRSLGILPPPGLAQIALPPGADTKSAAATLLDPQNLPRGLNAAEVARASILSAPARIRY